MALTWQGVTFQGGETWRTLLNYCCCKIPKVSGGSTDPILSALSGSVQSGELIALMGPSGAGKSTFFNILTNGRHFGKITGGIYVATITTEGGVGRASYLTQTAEDHLLPNLTVVESLRYASKLKNQHFTDREDHERVIWNLIKELNLSEVADKSTEVISGGQKKRLAIGLELTAERKPQFFILDEPLSGLDSCVGLEVIMLLSEFSKKFLMATIVTIHQPSFEILACFDHAYIISKKGQCIFNGAPGNMDRFLRQHGYHSGPSDNPADNMIKIASSVERDKPPTLPPADVERNAESEQQKMFRSLQSTCTRMAVTVLKVTTTRPARCTEVTDSGICENNDATFTCGALLTLFLRSAITSLLRQKKLIMIRAALHIVVAAVLAGLYNREIGTAAGCFVPNGWDPKNCSCIPTADQLRKESVTTQNVKFQFFSLLFLMFAALMPTVLTIPTEIKLFLNEHRNGWYTTLSYYISKTIIEIPVQLFLSGVYTVFLYWYSEQVGIELDRWYFGWRFCNFLLVTWISCFIAQGLGFLIGTICVNSFSISVILSSSVLLFLFLFSGFFVKVVEMKASVNWLTNLSFIRFAFESLLVVLFGFDRCDGSGQVKQAPIVLFTFGLEDADYNTNWAWLFVHLIVTRILAYISLKANAEPNFLTLNNGHSCAKAVVNRVTPCCKKLGQILFFILKVIMILFLLQLIIALIIGGIHSINTVNIE